MRIDLSNKAIWQQASGDNNRSYADLCIKWGVILNGPGDFGPWPACVTKMSEARSARKVTDIKRFSEVIQSGDLVVLRQGTDNVVGVGEVVGDYLWSDAFGDIDGWDLQHVRRVRWFWNGLEAPKKFAVYSLKQGDTTQKLNDNEDVYNWLKSIEISDADIRRELPPMPIEFESDTNIQEVAKYLYHRGVSGNSVNHLLSEFDELVRIAEWYHSSKNWPSESETIAYLVVPLMRVLGWSPQKMAVEWKNVDLALFDNLPRNDNNLSVVIECKKMSYSCLTAISQAESYGKDKPNCRRLIVTDGQRYGVFLKTDEKFVLNSYLNLTRLKSEYPVYSARGIQEAFRIMSYDFSR